MKKWLVGISGGIAAYKALELIRLLKKSGAAVKVVLSQNAKYFVTETAIQAVLGEPPYVNDNDLRCSNGMAHIELAKWADAVIVAPVTANRLAALANGFADDLLAATCLATTAPLWLAPAMNVHMWSNIAVQTNVQTLKERGVGLLGPAIGEQACGDYGLGRMLEPSDILSALAKTSLLEPTCLQGKRILVTAGPTQEAIDPVRYISNRSSGKMGFALAEAACAMGATVHLVTGPVALTPPSGVAVTSVKTALEMFDAVMTHVHNIDIFISAAAVADFRVRPAEHKLKKSSFESQLGLEIIANPDILSEVCQLKNRPFAIGFAAETTQHEQAAQEKLARKQCDLIVLNDVARQDIGFESDHNAVTVYSPSQAWELNKQPKKQLAYELMKMISEQFNAKNKA